MIHHHSCQPSPARHSRPEVTASAQSTPCQGSGPPSAGPACPGVTPGPGWPTSGATRPSGRAANTSNDRAFETLARCGKGADRIALRNELVRNNLPLVYAITARMGATAALPHDDLRQIGSLGLLRAIDAFEPARGRSLSSFAVPYIRGAIQHELRDRFSLMRIPRPLWELRRRATRLQDQRRRLGTPQLAPTQLAELLGCPTERVVEALNVGSVVEMRSLDAPTGAEGGEDGERRALIDLLPDPASLPAAEGVGAPPPSPAWIEDLLQTGAPQPVEAVAPPLLPPVTVTPAPPRPDPDGPAAAPLSPGTGASRAPRGAAGAGRATAATPTPAEMPPVPEPPPHGEPSAELTWLRACLGALSPVERSLLVGHVCRGLSWVELGRELGIQPRQTQRRTLALLQRLQAEGQRWRQVQAGTGALS